MKTRKIIPHLWFDNNAKEAVDFYVSVFNNSKIKSRSVIEGTPEGWANFLACLKVWLEYGINLRKGAFEFLAER